MRDYTHGSRCLMQLLQESLDDPSAVPCGRCSVCLRALPEPLRARPADETVARVTTSLRGETHVVDPRKMWPGGAFGSRGRIPAELMADPGRCLVFADAPEWREVVRHAFNKDDPAPQEVLDGCVRVLAEWKGAWAARPEVVVALAPAGLDRLVGSVADHLARVGRLERASLSVDPVSVDGLASGAEAAAWREVIAVGEDAAALVRGRVVLLVVDATSSLWPVTVAAAHLRTAGAARVLPLVLHRRP